MQAHTSQTHQRVHALCPLCTFVWHLAEGDEAKVEAARRLHQLGAILGVTIGTKSAEGTAMGQRVSVRSPNIAERLFVVVTFCDMSLECPSHSAGQVGKERILPGLPQGTRVLLLSTNKQDRNAHLQPA